MKTALVTGASRGIGAETARCLAREGWKVWINYNHSENEAQSLAAEIGGALCKADVSSEAEVEQMYEKTGGIDLLVNNAGIAHYALFTDTEPEQWRRLFATIADGSYHCIRKAIPYMVHQKSGCIINVSSVWGVCGGSCEAAYSAAKASLLGLTKALAKELGPSGIRVNCVAPGVIETDMLANLTAEDKKALCDETPLCRLGTPRDVAGLICYLASEQAKFITGQIIGVDGGFGL